MNKVLITFQTDKEMYEALRKEAFLKHVSKSEIIRQACMNYFESTTAKQNKTQTELKNTKEAKESENRT
jgi:septin family protein